MVPVSLSDFPKPMIWFSLTCYDQIHTVRILHLSKNWWKLFDLVSNPFESFELGYLTANSNFKLCRLTDIIKMNSGRQPVDSCFRLHTLVLWQPSVALRNKFLSLNDLHSFWLQPNILLCEVAFSWVDVTGHVSKLRIKNTFKANAFPCFLSGLKGRDP